MIRNYQNPIKKLAFAVLMLFMVIPLSAQTNAIGDAVTEIVAYWNPIKNLIMAIGGIVGVIGGIRIYNKWTNGDQDINKELVGWGGAALFLTLVPNFIGAFFGL
ncbi:MAG: DUF4134 family protein [Weeksellaceae bacterium]